MPWLQLILDARVDTAAELSEALSEVGAVAVTLQDAADQPLYEPPPGATPLWPQTRVIGLFDAGEDPDAVIERLRRMLGAEAVGHWRAEPLEDKDWQRAWMDAFQPMRFGTRLWIVPSWHSPPEPGAVNVMLDPGLAFGTGTHPTTALCLEWLDAQVLAGREVIDYGCGSGVLAVAAACLGARHVWAVDNDPQALQATRDNARKNQLDERITAVFPHALPAVRAEVLVANILAGPLMQLAPTLAALLSSGAPIALSGILARQAEEVVDAYRPWAALHLGAERDGWVRLEGWRK